MNPFRRRIGRRNRNVITGLLIAVASLIFVVYLLEIPRAQVTSFFLATLLFLFVIVVLAVVAIVVVKGLGRLLRKLQ